jgi:hypothetical protein
VSEAQHVAFVEALDRCWLERRFADLAGCLSPDVVVVPPDGRERLTGREAAVESYRVFMERSLVRHYQSGGYVVTECGGAAVVEYAWEMEWEAEGAWHEAAGREVLLLTRVGQDWRVAWRMQLAG